MGRENFAPGFWRALRGASVFVDVVRWFPLADSLSPPANFRCPSGTTGSFGSIESHPKQFFRDIEEFNLSLGE